MAERLASCGIAMSIYGVNSRDGLPPVEGVGGGGAAVGELGGVVGAVDTTGGALVVATMVQGWPVPRPPLLCTGSAPCVHQLAL
jgi:hypothetical protein